MSKSYSQATAVGIFIGCFISLLDFGAQGYGQSNEWQTFVNGDHVNAIADGGDVVWVGTNGALIKVDKSNGDLRFFQKINSGLPSNYVNSVAVEENGDVWAGVWGGGAHLVRFDGSHWTVYDRSAIGFAQMLHIWSIAIDRRGNKWIGTSNGLAKLEDGKWTIYTTANSGLPENDVRTVAVGQKNGIWCGTWGGGVARFDGLNWEVYNASNSPLTIDRIRTIVVDHANNIWLGGNNAGLFKFDGISWERYTSGNSGLPPGGHILSLDVDTDNNVWIGTRDGGLAKFDGGKNWAVYNKSNSGLHSNWINAILVDDANVKWIGPFTQLVKFDDVDWKIYHTSNSSLPDNFVYGIARGDGNNIWAGTGGGAVEFNGSDWKVYDPLNSGLPDAYVLSLTLDPEGNKWFGTGSAGLAKFDEAGWTVYNSSNSNLPANRVHSLTASLSGDMWIGTFSGLAHFDGSRWRVYDVSNSPLPENLVSALLIDDSTGNVWVGTWGGGLAEFDGNDWTVYDTDNSGLPHNDVRALTFDATGNLWVGTWGGGLAKFNHADWVIYNTVNSNLPTDLISGIAFDRRGSIWIASFPVSGGLPDSGGLAKFDDGEWAIYDAANSELPSNAILSLEIDEYDNIWIGTNSGVAVFHEGGLILDVKDEDRPVSPDGFYLHQNYPNPFNPETKISYQLSTVRNVELTIYDITGRRIRTLVHGVQNAGVHSVVWNGRDDRGREVASGIYLYRLSAGAQTQARRMVLLR